MMLRAHVLHLVARVALRVASPVRAFRLVRRARTASLDARAARHVAAALHPSGTCLTRALTVAAMTPGARVALGASGLTPPFAAHAWVDLNGQPLCAWDVKDHATLTYLAFEDEVAIL